jgi:hypothetical protein
MFLSLPKNENGNLDHGTVRYALHRLFVQRHGWYIKGLDNAGQSWNESSHANILKDQAADFVQSFSNIVWVTKVSTCMNLPCLVQRLSI